MPLTYSDFNKRLDAAINTLQRSHVNSAGDMKSFLNHWDALLQLMDEGVRHKRQ